MSSQPLFSVVVPTRNRAHLLVSALQSAVEQTFDDYEIIVSNNNSQDRTEEVVKDFADSGIRYVKTERTLSMPDHWEFAIEHARGRYVTYLCDDDGMAPQALARVAEVLSSSKSELVVLYSGLYYGPNWLDPQLRNVAVFAPFTKEIREHESAATIQRLFDSCNVTFEAPRMLNSYCNRETLMRVRADAGRIFMLCPDYSFAALILTAIPSWLYVDEPLHIQGVFPEGIGSSQIFDRGEASREYINEFREDNLLERVPLKSKVVSNLIAETYLMCQERVPELASYRIDWMQYFLSCWNNILVLEKNGVDVTKDRMLFREALATQAWGVRERLETLIDCAEGQDPMEAWAHRHPFRAAVRKIISRSELLSNMESRARGRRPNDPRDPAVDSITRSGAEAGFTNILECARRLPRLAFPTPASVSL